MSSHETRCASAASKSKRVPVPCIQLTFEVLIMTRKLSLILAAGLALLTSAGPMLAHHGTAAFDTKNVVTVKGTVTDFEFINPHCQIFFDVKNDKGEVEKWDGELTAPSKLSRAGWTKHTLKPGDEITVGGYPGKNDPHTIWIQKLSGPNGQTLPLNETQE
jgi:hypothetical protein